MASTLILSVQDGEIAFGEKVIFEGLTFNIHEGDKISLVGRNGAGKSTLMNIITGDKELDYGERWALQGTKIGYLQQEVTPKEGQTVYDFVFEYLKQQGEEEAHSYKVDMVIQPLDLNPDDMMMHLSGGQLRRASLARALVEAPDVLLLDEPTNHLDLEVIEWLEGYLKMYPGAVLCVSHDKTFLANISEKVFWLDRGRMRVCPRGFAHFDEWSAMLLEQEERELANRKKIVEQEVAWASRGVKARRKRNMRRLEKMRDERERLKKDTSSFRRLMRRIEVEPLDEAALGARVIAEFYKVHKTLKGQGRETPILEGLSYRISRGDRIGVLGRNGSGKTTFLRLLTGELEPDKGKIKRAKDLAYSYFDQKRQDLKPTETVKRILCPNGGDYVQVMGKMRHVCGYLKDFLFDPSMADYPVSALSGGQKNRLLLAKVLADPQALLILDEPTNDLDMDTLDMLEEILSQYNGTLIVVSHDRDFLDQTVSKVLAFEGRGVVDGCVGGYTDYVAYKKKHGSAAPQEDDEPVAVQKKAAVAPSPQRQQSAKKLTYKLQYELEQLPARIESLQGEIAGLEEKIADPALYTKDKDGFDSAVVRLGHARTELESAEDRWLELEAMKEAL